MPKNWVITEFTPGVGPWLPLPEDVDLTYYPGDTQVVNVMTDTPYALGELPDPLPELYPAGKLAPGINPTSVYEDDEQTGWKLWTWEPTEVLTPHGGMVVASETPPPIPLDTMIVLVDTTAENFDLMDGLLQAVDDRYCVLFDVYEEGV